MDSIDFPFVCLNFVHGQYFKNVLVFDNYKLLVVHEKRVFVINHVSGLYKFLWRKLAHFCQLWVTKWRRQLNQ